MSGPTTAFGYLSQNAERLGWVGCGHSGVIQRQALMADILIATLFVSVETLALSVFDLKKRPDQYRRSHVIQPV